MTPLAAAVLALAGAARAQDAPEVQSVQITARAPESAGVTGFSQPLSRTPIQADVIDTKVLADIGATSLSDLTRIDAGITTPIVIGYLVSGTGSFGAALVFVAANALLTVFCYLVVVGDIHRVALAKGMR